MIWILVLLLLGCPPGKPQEPATDPKRPRASQDSTACVPGCQCLASGQILECPDPFPPRPK